jgi:potassium-dependent mechanosensitive channel
MMISAPLAALATDWAARLVAHAHAPLVHLWLWQAQPAASPAAQPGAQATPAASPPPETVPAAAEQVSWYVRVWNEYLNWPLRIGETLRVSVASLVFALLILLAAYLVSSWVRAFLQTRLAARTRLDPGVQYTIERLTHYVVVVVGLLAALSVGLNIDVTSLAVLFTALSVGIGFGLQYIAGDIASGLILLFERPVRVGDFITVGVDSRQIEGKVRGINLRTTTVLTNDHITVIVPNSKLVSDNLINWSYAGRRARLSIPVGVSYNSDVDLVTELLLRAAEGVEQVLESPKPSVQFMDFGDSSLDFRLLVWTDRPRRHPQIKSEIRYRIRRLFKEAGVEIPFPQRDLNVRGGSLKIVTRPDADETREPDSLFDMDERGNLTRG